MIFETAIINALKDLDMPSSITPVLSDRDGVEPPSPYVLINILNTSKVGMPYKSITHKEGIVEEVIFQVKEIHVWLTFHARATDIVHDWVQHLDTGLHSDMFEWAFTKQGLGFVRADDLLYQPQPVSGTAYKRAILGLTFRTEVQDSFRVNALNRVNIEGDITDSVGANTGDVVVDIFSN